MVVRKQKILSTNVLYLHHLFTDPQTFVIGVGSRIDRNELELMSTSPSCQHLSLLKSFSEIEALTYTIDEKSCLGKE